jgi:hypothetical protein
MTTEAVIPAKVGIERRGSWDALDPRLRGDDGTQARGLRLRGDDGIQARGLCLGDDGTQERGL